VVTLSNEWRKSHWCLSARHHASIMEFEHFSSVNARTRRSTPVLISASTWAFTFSTPASANTTGIVSDGVAARPASTSTANRGLDQPPRAHEGRTHAGDNTIGKAEIRRPFPRPIEDEQLLLEEHRFGNHRTGAARTSKAGDCRQQMEDEDGQVAHVTILPRRQRAEILMI